MPPAAAIIGSSVVGGLISSNAASNAADAQVAAANQANSTQLQMFHESNALNAPWRNQGTSAVNLLGNAYTNQPGGQAALQNAFMASPGYDFRLQQGQQQVDRMAARGGNFFSGRALQGAAEYGQNFASNEFGNYINQLNSLAGIGQTSAGQSANNAMNTGQIMGQNFQNAGAARAGAYLGQANALNGMIGNIANYAGYAGWGQPGPYTGAYTGSGSGGISGYGAPLTWNWGGG